MKKIVALVLSLVMALSLCTVAFAYADGDTFYDGTTQGVAKEYTYVDKYTAGDTNTLPYFVDAGGTWYLAEKSGSVVMYDKDLKATDLYLGKALTDESVKDYQYNFKAEVQKAQDWACDKDQLKDGYKYLDKNDDEHYAVADKNGDIKLLVDGKIIKAKEYTPVTGQHILYYTGAKMTEVKVGVFQVCLLYTSPSPRDS